ncbi:MAG TPA: hypothetical protein VLS44_02725 [Nitrospira sp.]|nr:hypothetical protein [Nitrospira sp.]
MSRHVKEIAVPGIDDPLHFGHPSMPEAFLREPLREFGSRVGKAMLAT